LLHLYFAWLISRGNNIFFYDICFLANFIITIIQWTVNGELRIGFFATKNIAAGEEVTFDYQFQRYG
jgi:hypothetical protein